MKRKKRRDQRARPSGMCCSQQKPEDKQRVDHMNQGVNEQMATCVHAEELAVDHMCDPREWMPVCHVKSGERPSESRERNAAIHHWVLPDIRIVVERDELMPDHLRINRKRHYRETEQDEEIGSPKCCTVADPESFRGSSIGRGRATSFSLLRCPFGHAVCYLCELNCACARRRLSAATLNSGLRRSAASNSGMLSRGFPD